MFVTVSRTRIVCLQNFFGTLITEMGALKMRERKTRDGKRGTM